MVESVTNNPAAQGITHIPFHLSFSPTGTFHDWTLLLYGTAEPAQNGDPVHPPAPITQTVLGRVHQLTSQVRAYFSSGG